MMKPIDVLIVVVIVALLLAMAYFAMLSMTQIIR